MLRDKTILVTEPDAVDLRLRELGLSRSGLLNVRTAALADAANATGFHCANAAGTYKYQTGSWGLRQFFVGDDWEIDRSAGVEAIFNPKLRIRVAYCNVDTACRDDQPKPRSPKGSGAEKLCMGTLFGEGGLPHYAPRAVEDIATYYLMVDDMGAAELSRPVIERGTFVAMIERIYVSLGDDLVLEPIATRDIDPISDFDPKVERK